MWVLPDMPLDPNGLVIHGARVWVGCAAFRLPRDKPYAFAEVP